MDNAPPENDVELRDHYWKMGSESYAHGDLESALAHWHKAVEVNPDNADAHYNLGIGLSNSGETAAAVQEWQEAIRLRPDFLQAHQCLCNRAIKHARSTNRRNDWKTANALCRNVIKIEPNSIFYLTWLARGERTLRNFRAAVKVLEAAIEIDPSNQWAYRELIRLRWRLGRWRDMWQTVRRMTEQSTFDRSTCRPSPVCVLICVTVLGAIITGGVLLIKKAGRKD